MPDPQPPEGARPRRPADQFDVEGALGIPSSGTGPHDPRAEGRAPADADQGDAADGYADADDGHADDGYADQGYGDQGYADQGDAADGYADADDGHADDGYADQGYGDQGYADQGYAADDLRHDERWDDDGWDEDGWDDAPGADGGGRDDYVSVKGDRPGGRRWLAVVLALLLVIVVALGGAAWWVRGQIDPGDAGDEVAFTIPSGATTGDIARLLEEKGIITNPTIFEWYLRFNGGGPFEAGDYQGLRTNSAMGDVIDVLDAGPTAPEVITVTFREGLWLSETRDLILETFPGMDPAALDAAIAAVRVPIMPDDAPNPEGVLFPATYEVLATQANDPNVLLTQMVAAFERVSATQGLPDAAATLEGVAGDVEITPYEALIVASMVEAEARTEADRPKIARVIYNRLAEDMRLDIDATVLYALGDRQAQLTTSQLQTDSPYNTRLLRGMPPTPINNPGEASIQAALNPAEGDWLFYVLADEEGNHEFTTNLSDHEDAVARAREKGLF